MRLNKCIQKLPQWTSPAIIQTGNREYTLSHGELEQQILKLEHDLHEANIIRGSTVCVAMRNSPELVIFMFSVLALGVRVAPLNPLFKAPEFEHFIDELKADLVVGHDEAFDKGTPLEVATNSTDTRKFNGSRATFCRTADDFQFTLVKQGARLSPAPVPGEASLDQNLAALILHTSGTTGKPKAVPVSEANIVVSVANMIAAYSLGESDRVILVMPLFHIHGIIAGLLAPLLCGSCVIISTRVLSESFWTDFMDYSATWWTATPSHYLAILSFQVPTPRPQVRFNRCCSAPLPLDARRLLETNLKTVVLEAYGMTKNAHHIASQGLNSHREPGSVGRACPSIEVKIVNKDGDEVPCGDTGEIWIRGPSVMRGYIDNKEANKLSSAADQWFKIGDLGRLDDQSCLRLGDRLKDVVVKGGEKISPSEIEEKLKQHPSVAEVACVPVKDKRY